MRKRGAPLGNNNAGVGKAFKQALRVAVLREARNENGKRIIGPDGKPMRVLDMLVEKLIQLALDGNIWAIREIGDRLDGKPPRVS